MERAIWYFLYFRVKPKMGKKRYNQNSTPSYFSTACNSQFKKKKKERKFFFFYEKAL